MKYNIETLTIKELIELIKSGDDSKDNQIRVTKAGIIYISQLVGAEDIEELNFRFETFDSGNGYVGEDAANDSKYIDVLYRALKMAWNGNKTGCIYEGGVW